MGRFSDLEKQAREAEQRVQAGQERVVFRALSIRDNFRQRYLVGTLIIAGLAVGIAAHQFIRIRAIASARRRVRKQAVHARPAPSSRSPGLRRRAIALLPLAQIVAKSLFNRQGKRGKTRKAPPEAIAPVADLDAQQRALAAQRMRSTSLANHSNPRNGNGRLRH